MDVLVLFSGRWQGFTQISQLRQYFVRLWRHYRKSENSLPSLRNSIKVCEPAYFSGMINGFSSMSWASSAFIDFSRERRSPGGTMPCQ